MSPNQKSAAAVTPSNPVTPDERLRRVATLCCHVLRNLAFYRSGWRRGSIRTHQQFWVNANGNSLDTSVVEWCKLFGRESEKHRWQSVVKDQQRFQQGLLKAMRFSEADLERYTNEMKAYRDKFVVHLDDARGLHRPKTRPARLSVAYLYRHLVQVEDQKSILSDATTTPGAFYAVYSEKGGARMPTHRKSRITSRRGQSNDENRSRCRGTQTPTRAAASAAARTGTINDESRRPCTKCPIYDPPWQEWIRKSTLLRTLDSGKTFQTNYITPERGGTLKYDPNIDVNLANNERWITDDRRKNRTEHFRQQSATQFRNLEILVLREIEQDKKSVTTPPTRLTKHCRRSTTCCRRSSCVAPIAASRSSTSGVMPSAKTRSPAENPS